MSIEVIKFNIQNPTLKVPVIETFSSIQGEGPYAGQNHLFLRFDKCNLACDYCDELHKESKMQSIEQIIEQVVHLERQSGAHYFLCFTGGEPLLYPKAIDAIVKTLSNFFYYYLETNGTLTKQLEEVIELVDVVAMDIKLKSVGDVVPQFSLNQKFLEICQNENKEVFVKIIVGSTLDELEFIEAISVIERVDPSIPLILQPLTSDVDKVSIDFLRKNQLLALQRLEDVRVMARLHEVFNVQ